MMGRILFLNGLQACALAGIAAAQDYPDRPIRMVAPQTAGGSMDTNARALSDLPVRELRQNIIIDNRGGTNGVIAGVKPE